LILISSPRRLDIGGYVSVKLDLDPLVEGHLLVFHIRAPDGVRNRASPAAGKGRIMFPPREAAIQVTSPLTTSLPGWFPMGFAQ
jgi:hypothetical protein